MFTKTSMIVAAAFGAVLITAVDLAQSSTPPQMSAAEQVTTRFPQANEIFLPVNFVRTTPVNVKSRGTATKCSGEHWPAISDECLASSGTPEKKPVRMITSERRYADASFALVG
jgi:hypothetical protein